MRPRLRLSSVLLAAVATATFGLDPGSAQAQDAPSGAHYRTDWPVRTVQAGHRAVLRVALRGPAVQATSVSVQRDIAGNWLTWRSQGVPVGQRRANFRLPTDVYGRFAYRVRTSVGAPGQAARRLYGHTHYLAVRPGYRPTGTASMVRLAHHGSQPPPRWNPCQTITYQTNLTGASSSARAGWLTAIRRLHAASGLRFRSTGTTHMVPNNTWGQHQQADLVMAFTTPTHNRILARDPHALALGGSWWTADSQDSHHRPVARRIHGYVVVNRHRQALMTSGTGPRSWAALFMHELGHVVGLAHVAHPSQVMYPVLAVRGSPGAHYGHGDLHGLAQLGAAQGCLHPRY